MKIIVDKSADVLYIHINKGTEKMSGVITNTVIADENINLDYDKDGKLLGIEILSLNILDLEELKTLEYTENDSNN